jgi:hypothetical protein
VITRTDGQAFVIGASKRVFPANPCSVKAANVAASQTLIHSSELSTRWTRHEIACMSWLLAKGTERGMSRPK